MLAIAGCSNSKVLRRDPLQARYGTSFTLIGQRAAEISRAIREGVMSAAFEVIVVPPPIGNTSHFDEGSMENVFAGIQGAERGRVLCTVEFGLACARRTSSIGGTPASDTQLRQRSSSHGSHASVNSIANGAAFTNGIDTGSSGELGTFTRSLLLKPKVLLESVKEVL